MSVVSANEWAMVKLGDLVSIKTGKLNSNAAKPGGQYPFFTCSRETSRTDTYSFDCECVLLAGNNAEGRYPINYFKGKFDAYQRTYVIRSNDDQRLSNLFLFYALQPKLELLRSISTGATTKFLTLTILQELDLSIPRLKTQHTIAAVLSGYDDLIENNNRRIKILEEVARLIYREWFINFRFPGHEKIRMVDSAMGQIPEGWEVGVFGHVANIVRDGINPSDYPNEVFDHFSIPAFDNGCMPATETGFTIRSNKYLLADGCVLLAKLNPRIPRVWLPFPSGRHRAICSTEFLVLLPRGLANREFLFYMCLSDEFIAWFAGLALGTSTSHQRVKREDLLKRQQLLPSANLIAKFGDLVAPMLEMTNLLRVSNGNLRRTRDLLLPKLVSDQLDVSELDIDVREEAA